VINAIAEDLAYWAHKIYQTFDYDGDRLRHRNRRRWWRRL